MRKLILACLVLAGCATSAEQKLLDADNAYSATQDRVLKYNALPECSATVTSGCEDPAAKADLKATVAANAGASGDVAVNAANAAVKKALDAHKINCGAGAADTCP